MRWHIMLLMLAFALTPVSCCRSKALPPHRAATGSTVLLTGYEPFGGYTFNTSWEAIKPLDGTEMRGRRISCVMLPVAWEKASERLSDAIAQAKPEAVICFGMGTKHISIETTARNERRPYPDNTGQLPRFRQIVQNGPEVFQTRLPVDAILKRMKQVGEPCVTSNDAGGYLCNEAFYTCMVEAERRGMRVAGLVHMPVVHPGSADFARFVETVKAIVETCVDALDTAGESVVTGQSRLLPATCPP